MAIIYRALGNSESDMNQPFNLYNLMIYELTVGPS